MIEWIAQQIGHGRRKGIKFFTIRSVTGDEALVDAIGAHGTPFIMISVEPDLGEIVPLLIMGNFLGWKVAVEINDG